MSIIQSIFAKLFAIDYSGSDIYSKHSDYMIGIDFQEYPFNANTSYSSHTSTANVSITSDLPTIYLKNDSMATYSANEHAHHQRVNLAIRETSSSYNSVSSNSQLRPRSQPEPTVSLPGFSEFIRAVEVDEESRPLGYENRVGSTPSARARTTEVYGQAEDEYLRHSAYSFPAPRRRSPSPDNKRRRISLEADDREYSPFAPSWNHGQSPSMMPRRSFSRAHSPRRESLYTTEAHSVSSGSPYSPYSSYASPITDVRERPKLPRMAFSERNIAAAPRTALREHSLDSRAPSAPAPPAQELHYSFNFQRPGSYSYPAPTYGSTYGYQQPRQSYAHATPFTAGYAPSTYTHEVEATTQGDTRQRKRRGNLPKATTNVLNAWFFDHLQHAYPSEEEKVMLMEKTGLQMNQISNWFINARRRKLPTLQNNARAEANARLRAAEGSEPVSPGYGDEGASPTQGSEDAEEAYERRWAR